MMKMPEQLDVGFLAPCGVNCFVCMAHLRTKNACPGCLSADAGLEKPTHCRTCGRKLCAETKGLTHCFACEAFPCQRIRSLDQRYRARYAVSVVENGIAAREQGLTAFMEAERSRWTCPHSGSAISQHEFRCSACGAIFAPGGNALDAGSQKGGENGLQKG